MPYIIKGVDKERVREIIRSLQRDGIAPYKHIVIGCLQNVLRKVLDVTIELDDWPAFTSIVLLLHYPQLEKGDETDASLRCYSTDANKLAAMLSESSVVPWKQQFSIAVPVPLEPVWKKAIQDRGVKCTRNPDKLLQVYTSHDKVVNPAELPLPAGYSLGTLRPEHAQLVSSYWIFGGSKRMDARVRYTIQRLPSVCIYNERGEPASWVCNYLDGSTGLGHTMPTSRHAGLYKVALAAIGFRLAQANINPLAYIVKDNRGATSAIKGIAARQDEDHAVFLDYTPPRSML